MKVVAIDGPCYVGKSQIAKALAGLTGFDYLNTGSLYRAVAKRLMERSGKNLSTAEVRRVLRGMRFRLAKGRLFVNGKDWTHVLDDPKIVLFASQIAKDPELRNALTEIQRSYVRTRNVVIEGRDIGTVVFPKARWKFYVTASVPVRALRLHKTLKAQGKSDAFKQTLYQKKIQEIDHADMTRKIAPLRPAKDAIVYDNSLSPSAVQDAWILHYYMMGAKEIRRNGKYLRAS